MTTIVSEMTGMLIEVLVQAGEAVAKGQDLFIVESMKMEIPVSAPAAGTVEAVHVQSGDKVEPGMVLATFIAT